jgi:hypothetical protein
MGVTVNRQANERATATDRRYSTLMIVLHWSTAIVVAVAYAAADRGALDGLVQCLADGHAC